MTTSGNYRFLGAIVVVALAISWLVYSAVQASAKSVVTVKALVEEGSPASSIRLGARVADNDISYQTSPSFELQFSVVDPPVDSSPKNFNGEAPREKVDTKIPVVFRGMRPDTFQAGRDVILEGDFDGQTFFADTLLTQCPSKYEAPIAPGSGDSSQSGDGLKKSY